MSTRVKVSKDHPRSGSTTYPSGHLGTRLILRFVQSPIMIEQGLIPSYRISCAVFVQTPKMSRIRFSSDTKMHDGLCKTSLNVEAIYTSYYNGELNSVKDLESFCTKLDCHNHLPSVVESISTLLVKLKNAGPGDKIPLLRRGGGKTYKMTCAHIESVTYLYNMLLKLV